MAIHPLARHIPRGTPARGSPEALNCHRPRACSDARDTSFQRSTMKSARRKVLATVIAAGAAAMFAGGPALAQGEYPNKPITIVVAYPAGGDVDVLARMFAE